VRECHPTVAAAQPLRRVHYSARVPEFAVPIMPSKDLDATLSFYERLGFENAGGAPSELNYLIIRRGGVQLHFYGEPDVDPLTTSFSCYVFTEDADALFETWKAIGITTDPITGSRLQGRRPTPITGCVSSLWSTRAGTSSASARHRLSDRLWRSDSLWRLRFARLGQRAGTSPEGRE
jgi:hypothetical protein